MTCWTKIVFDKINNNNYNGENSLNNHLKTVPSHYNQ